MSLPPFRQPRICVVRWQGLGRKVMQELQSPRASIPAPGLRQPVIGVDLDGVETNVPLDLLPPP
eukprot:2047031-Pyramimonas_sp.AAC.1